jgi:hypothetical protein
MMLAGMRVRLRDAGTNGDQNRAYVESCGGSPRSRSTRTGRAGLPLSPVRGEEPPAPPRHGTDPFGAPVRGATWSPRRTTKTR